LQFHIKAESKSKCFSCIHAHLLTVADSNKELSYCRLLGAMMGEIRTCSQWVPHMLGPVPMQMAMNAWLLTPDGKDRKKMGFEPPHKTAVILDDGD
jgi:hypothetical protein